MRNRRILQPKAAAVCRSSLLYQSGHVNRGGILELCKGRILDLEGDPGVWGFGFAVLSNNRPSLLRLTAVTVNAFWRALNP